MRMRAAAEEREVRTAVLYHRDSLRAGELEAAFRGLSRLGRFGVICETLDVASQGGLGAVKRGIVIKDAIYSQEAFLHPFDLLHPGAWEGFSGFFRERRIIPLGVIPGRLFESGEGAPQKRLGLSAYGRAGAISLSRIRLMKEKGLALRAIELAAAHETGHILGRQDHCGRDCLMSENSDFDDFISRHVRGGLDFCRECLRKIEAGVERLRERPFL
jgi:hypothetical protein